MILGDGNRELEPDLDRHLDQAWNQEEAEMRVRKDPDPERPRYVDVLEETLSGSKLIEHLDAEFEKESQPGPIRKLAALFSRPRKED